MMSRMLPLQSRESGKIPDPFLQGEGRAATTSPYARPSRSGHSTSTRRAVRELGKTMKDWISLWDSDHPIYVNARHFDVHYRAIAADIIRLLPSREARVLDHGCGA